MSEVKVNKISPRTACGTVTLGDSGDTFTIPSGATITNSGTATGFGRTGTVDWQTGDIKTAAFIPATGKGYFVNTTGGAITVNLPAGSAGDIVGLKDYAGTWDSYAVTLNPNGSDKIGGGSDIDPTLTSEGGAVLLVYVDGTQGWLTTAESVTTSPSGLETFVTATVSGACNTLATAPDCANTKIATFLGPGTFCVSVAATAAADNVVSYVVAAGGAGGGAGSAGSYASGGGGAGGFREYKSPVTPYTASPLDGNPGGTAITVSASPYPITVGGGGAGSSASGCTPGVSGDNSVFDTITSAGGGGGGAGQNPGSAGVDGGSGGGGGTSPGTAAGGAGNTPSVSPAQGNDGGDHNPGVAENAAGGGGATAAGTDAVPGTTPVAGGAGATTSISASPVTYATGGASGNFPSGATANGPTNSGTGGKGAGGCSPGTVTGGNGGSGIVILRYKFQ